MKQRLSFWVALVLIATSLHAAKADVVSTNNAGVSLSFSSSNSYEWEWNSYIGSNGGLRSTNYHLGSTTSQTSITIEAQTDCKFIFDYTVSSESGYDKLSISIDNNTFVDNISGSSSSSCTVQLSRGSHTMTLKYVKDSSADSGDDRAYVSNFRFTSTGPIYVLDLDDGLPGRELPGSIVFESPLFTSETPLTFLRLTVLETESNRSEAYGYSPYFNLSEFYLYDAEGNRIELSADNFFSNAREPREGSYEGLCDASLNTFFHSCWSTGVGEDHYIEVAFREPLNSFSFAYEVINVYDDY